MIPPVITTSATAAPGPASVILWAASTSIQIPAAASAKPAPTPRMFFATADIVLPAPPIPFAAPGTAFPAALKDEVKPLIAPPIPSKIAKPATSPGMSASTFLKGSTSSSPRKSANSPNPSLTAFHR